MTGLRHGRHRLELRMTNFDHSIDEGLAEALLADPTAYAPYSGWEFFGVVVAEGGRFLCEVWRYHSVVKVFDCGSLEEVMREVSGEFGYE